MKVELILNPEDQCDIRKLADILGFLADGNTEVTVSGGAIVKPIIPEVKKVETPAVKPVTPPTPPVVPPKEEEPPVVVVPPVTEADDLNSLTGEVEQPITQESLKLLVHTKVKANSTLFNKVKEWLDKKGAASLSQLKEENFKEFKEYMESLS